ncbi:hypothetical protein ACFW6F_20855 [Streptomyces sp. NPDC058746]|uniref:hypothetical protein n=1 Tax=Streptomyces sp. NPDC058746 TaxID=3346622 RepID=UPI0036BB1FA5
MTAARPTVPSPDAVPAAVPEGEGAGTLLRPAKAVDSVVRSAGMPALLSHRAVDEETLLVRLPPRLSIRIRGAATLALAELLTAYCPRHLVLEVPDVLTPVGLSTVLRASRSCQAAGAVLSVVAPASSSRVLLRDPLRAAGRVYGSTGEALAAARRTHRAI